MAIHELATNAAKYGSLSVPQGKLKVVWTTQLDGPSRHLHLTWSESKGPPVTKPSRTGFGSTLIERVLKGQHGASFASEFNPAGFRFRLSLALKGPMTGDERWTKTDAASGGALGSDFGPLSSQTLSEGIYAAERRGTGAG
jgi:hypothetical protein